MIRFSYVATAALLSFAAAPAFAADTVLSTNATALGTALSGTGFNLTSASLSSSSENGFFSNGSAFGIDHGVVLTTGTLGCVGNANTVGNCTGPGTGGSLALNFTLDGDSLFFNYVFGSEEYNEFVNSGFNDSFSLLLNGPGFTDFNLATVPGSGDAVTIDNVNNGSNSVFFVDNSAGGSAFQLDGFTTVLTASATGLTPGAAYSLTFNIADVGDSAYDSAVFIQGGTIGTVEVPPGAVPEPATWAMMLIGFGTIGGAMRRRRRQSTLHAVA